MDGGQVRRESIYGLGVFIIFKNGNMGVGWDVGDSRLLRLALGGYYYFSRLQAGVMVLAWAIAGLGTGARL